MSGRPDWARLEAAFGFELKPEQERMVLTCLDLLDRWNRVANLTSMAGTTQRLKWHFFEAFWAASHWVAPHSRVVDIGTGAGFPGIPIQIMRPHASLALVESNARKCAFLREVRWQLRLNFEIFEGRAEEFPFAKGGTIATLRAVSPSPQLLERLADAGVPLLWFHTSPAPAVEPLFACSERLRVPTSTHRFVSFFRPAAEECST